MGGEAAGRRIPQGRPGNEPRKAAGRGAALVIGVSVLTALGARTVGRLARGRGLAGALAQAFVLKYSFSLRRLPEAAFAVGEALDRGDLDTESADRSRPREPRYRLAGCRGRVRRIESVAENLTDSLAAPLLYYVPAGIPGAWAYRVANTADAMVGYRAGHLARFRRDSTTC
jgi:adenosylcobinamide-phosphate synthase